MVQGCPGKRFGGYGMRFEGLGPQATVRAVVYDNKPIQFHLAGLMFFLGTLFSKRSIPVERILSGRKMNWKAPWAWVHVRARVML